MATKFSSALQMTNSTDALFRAWCQFVADTLTNGGWLDNGDTGQLTISTATHPTLTNTVVGYRVYKMNDTLQATKPCVMKLQFGSGAAANTPVLTVTIGTGSDGAGTITGTLCGPLAVTSALNGTNATNSYGSANTNRFQILLFVRNAATDSLLFSIERTHDGTTGADTGDGFLVTWQNTTPGSVTNWVNSTPGSQPPAENGFTVVLSNVSISSFGSNTGVGFPLHYKGYVQPVAIGVIIVNKGDFLAGAQPTVSVYGTSHTYQLADSDTSAITHPIGNFTTGNAANRRFGILFE